MTDSPIAFQWRNDEDDQSRHGEGISRPVHGSRTREFRVIVYKSGGQPMTWITKAESSRHAIRYAEARWPGAEVEMG